MGELGHLNYLENKQIGKGSDLSPEPHISG